MRIDQRKPSEMRPVKVTTDYLLTAEGSALIEVGKTADGLAWAVAK